MSEKINNILVSNDIFDRNEDKFAYIEFGGFNYSKYSINFEILSDSFWSYLMKKFKINKSDIKTYCDIHRDVKNREERLYSYVVNIHRPHKILLHFYDENHLSKRFF